MKRKKLALLGLFVAGILSASTVGFYVYQKNQVQQEMPAMPEGMELSESVVTATGLTSAGMSQENYSLGFLEDGLYVEEICFNLGDEVETGTAVFKVSQESLESARNKLEKALTEAQLNSREGRITLESGLIEAEETKKLADAEASWAQTVYDNAVADAQAELDSVQKQVDEAQEKVEEYTASAESDYYAEYYQVEELRQTWKDYAAFLAQLYQEWNVAALEDVFGGSGGKNGIGYVTNQVSASESSAASGTLSGSSASSGSSAFSGSSAASGSSGGTAPSDGSFFSQDTVVAVETAVTPETESTEPTGIIVETGSNTSGFSGNSIEAGGMGQMGTPGSDEIRYNIYLAMVEEADEAKELYEEAEENYETAKETAAAGLGKAKSELTVLQAKLAEQQISYQKAVLEAQNTYEQTVANQKNAQLVYETTVKSLEEEYQTLQDVEETAQNHLELFEEQIGDGTFYTTKSGTVVMTNVRAENWLKEDSVVLAFNNPETISVAASVGQSDIASVSIGEDAVVMISGYGMFEATVTSFNPVSETSGSTSVTYVVNVELQGDCSNLESNLTAYVYFGLTEEEKTALTQANSGQMQPGDGDVPSGTGTLPSGNASDGMPEGSNGASPGDMGEFSGGNAPSGDAPSGADRSPDGKTPAGTGDSARSQNQSGGVSE